MINTLASSAHALGVSYRSQMDHYQLRLGSLECILTDYRKDARPEYSQTMAL
jgi:hypothetical protein